MGLRWYTFNTLNMSVFLLWRLLHASALIKQSLYKDLRHVTVHMCHVSKQLPTTRPNMLLSNRHGHLNKNFISQFIITLGLIKTKLIRLVPRPLKRMWSGANVIKIISNQNGSRVDLSNIKQIINHMLIIPDAYRRWWLMLVTWTRGKHNARHCGRGVSEVAFSSLYPGKQNDVITWKCFLNILALFEVKPPLTGGSLPRRKRSRYNTLKKQTNLTSNKEPRVLPTSQLSSSTSHCLVVWIISGAS